ncbi:MAG: RES family NAD+ phosphorylase [Cyanobacteria bacterium P01_F01_bin.33]
MRLYRIAKEKYLASFSGRGKSFLDGARWNQPGFSVLYFAPSPAVALLEMANYLPSPRLVPKNYRLGIYELPDEVSCKTLEIADMPPDWAKYPYPASTQAIGSEWLREGASLCLFVPSAAVPSGLEQVVVVNPMHPEIATLKLVDVRAHLYNDRAFQGI